MLSIPLLNVFFVLDLSSLAMETNSWMCFCEQVGLQAHGTSRRMDVEEVDEEEQMSLETEREAANCCSLSSL